MKHKYMVVSALQEEMNAFTDLAGKEIVGITSYVNKVTFFEQDKKIEVLTFTPNKMGMPYNATAITEEILRYKPLYILFIGICAGLKGPHKHKLGTVLVPTRVFSHESGKYENGTFYPDYVDYYTSEYLHAEAERLRHNLHVNRPKSYEVLTDLDFCSGAAVINDENKVKEIIAAGARKLTGLDMEAYSIACVHHMLNSVSHNKYHLTVIKAISDFAINKDQSQNEGGRDLAKRNAADFALELIKHLDRVEPISKNQNKLEIIHFPIEDNIEKRKFKLKLRLDIKNPHDFPVTIKSLQFVNKDIKIDPKAGKHRKPLFKAGVEIKNGASNDIYKEIYTIEPRETIKSWIPIDPEGGLDSLQLALANQNIGTWHYECYWLNRYDVEFVSYEYNFDLSQYVYP